MRDKLFTHGRDVFHTHELLEMLLYHVVPYKNTNPTAEELLHRLGTLDGVFSADRETLLSIEGIGPRIADLIEAAGIIDIKKSIETFSDKVSLKFDNYKWVGEFFTEYFGEKLTNEVVLVLLNNKMEYIGFESIIKSDFDSAAIRPEPFVDAAIANRAAVAIVAHNHPYGPTFPTLGDKASNDMLFNSFKDVGVIFAEHYVTSGKNYVGFMSHLSADFSQYTEIERFLKSKEELG